MPTLAEGAIPPRACRPLDRLCGDEAPVSPVQLPNDPPLHSPGRRRATSNAASQGILFHPLTVRSARPPTLAVGEHGIIGAGHELGAIKRSLATRTDGLP